MDQNRREKAGEVDHVVRPAFLATSSASWPNTAARASSTLPTSTLRPCSAMTRTKISANDGWAESRVSPASKNTARNRAMRPSRGEAWEGRGVWGTTLGVYARCYWGGPKRSTRSFHKTSTLRSRSSRVPRLSTT